MKHSEIFESLSNQEHRFDQYNMQEPRNIQGAGHTAMWIFHIAGIPAVKEAPESPSRTVPAPRIDKLWKVGP